MANLPAAQAATVYSWSGASSALWSDAGNWIPSGVPASGDTLAFPSGAAHTTNTNDLATGTMFPSLVFNGSGYVIGGNGLTLGGTLTAKVGGITTLNLPLDVATNAVTFDVYNLVLGGSLSGSGSITLTQNGQSGTRISASGSFIGAIINNDALNFDAISMPVATILNTNFLSFNGTSLPTTAVTHTSPNYALFGGATIGALTASGPVYPGNSYSCGSTTSARLLNTGNLSLSGQTCFALDGGAAGTGYSQLKVTGTVGLGVGSSLTIALDPSFAPAQGQHFVLIDNDAGDAVSGAFDGLPEGSVVTVNAVYQFQISYAGGSGNDVVLTCVVAPRAWTGASNALWSNPANWSPAGVPASGELLLFPPAASHLVNTNDLVAGTSFSSLVFSGAGYTVGGNAIALTTSLSAKVGGPTLLNLPIDVGANAIAIDAFNLVLGGSLSGSGPITVVQNSQNGLRIAASGSYSGTITNNDFLSFDAVSMPAAAIINNRLLSFNGSSLPTTAITHNNSGYALFGGGTIGALTASGAVYPADNYSCGFVATTRRLNTGTLSLNGPACFALAGTAAATGYSQIKVAGTVALGASSSLDLVLSSSFVPAQGQQFVLIDNDGSDAVSGTFAGLPEGSLITLNAIYQFKLSYAGGSGNDVVLTCIVAPRAWTGAASVLWSNPSNWTPTGAPQAGDILLFPSGAAHLSNTNDLATGLALPSLVFNGAGYSIGGNGIALTSSITAHVGPITLSMPIDVGTHAITFDVFDLVLGGSLSGSGPITLTTNSQTGVRIAASGSYTGTITNNDSLSVDAVALPIAAIVNNRLLALNGASLPATTITHQGSSYSLYGHGAIGPLLASSPVYPGNSYLCGVATTPGLFDTGNLSLGDQGCFALNGASAGAGYSQFKVTGTVALGANSAPTLVLASNFVPAQGQHFVLIDNDGSDPVSGTFNGLPEGSLITLNSVYQFQLSYVGGSGNDVVLTSLNGLSLPTATLASSVNPSVPLQNITFTATVTGSGPIPTGSVTFLDGSGVLGSGTLNAAGVATYSTTALSVGTHPIAAQYNSDAYYGGAVSATLAQVVGQASQNLSFDPPPTIVVTGTGTVHASSALPNSGNPVQYGTTSTDCSVNASSGLVTGIHVGTNTCTITATQAGDANYLAGSATQILSVVKVSASLSLASACMHSFVESQPFTLTATVTGLSPTGSVTFDDGNAGTLCAAVVLSSGMATCTSSALTSPAATTGYLLGASYSGDANNAPSAATSPLSIQVLSAVDVLFRHGFEAMSSLCPIQ